MGSEMSEIKAHEAGQCSRAMCFSVSEDHAFTGKESKMQKLSDAAAGRYTVKWIFTEPDLKQILKEIRIEVGKEITVISNCFGQILLRSETGAYIIDAEAAWGVTV